MKRMTLFVLATMLFMYACSAAAPTDQASDSSLGYPLETKTGIKEVDDVLAAIAGGDPDELRALIQFTQAPCTTADGLGGPPKCKTGETEGTMLEVLPILGAEGSFIRKSEIENWPGLNATALYAVYRLSENAGHEQYYLPGEYEALFLQQDNQSGIALHITDGRIVRIDSIFSPNGNPNPFSGFGEEYTNKIEKVILEPKIR